MHIELMILFLISYKLRWSWRRWNWCSLVWLENMNLCHSIH